MAATGCFKCGRPGHWSRDCPSDPSVNKNGGQDKNVGKPPPSLVKSQEAAAAKKVKVKRSNKLTVDALLSEDGLGYVLEKVPHMINIKGPGHEIEDLGSFINAYRSWHAHLFPQVPFKRFLEQVEDLGSSRRVRNCLDELKDKVYKGEELKLSDYGTSEHESREEDQTQDYLFEKSREVLVQNDSQAEKLQEIEIQFHQRARMEANRLKALERVRARNASITPS